MIRNILRISRYLARRQINGLSAVRRIPCAESLSSYYILPVYRKFSSSPASFENVDPAVFEDICSETLESLCEYFEEIVEKASNLQGADVTYSDGVLTVALGSYGTYVINRQTPNKQIWLSSPVSGPKRYDLVIKNGGHWIYKHDGVTLHQLLQEEISKIVPNKVDFSACSHSLV